jgi:protocatechuate 3,4-dioxygenase, beta subunit
MFLTRRTAVLGMTSSVLLIGSRGHAQLKTTPTGDIGPFYPVVRGADADNDLTLIGGRSARAAGQIIEVAGRVLDKHGRAIRGATIELWQANAAGRYSHPADINPTPLDPNFQGFGKLVSGSDGSYRYTTVKPGPYNDGDDSPRPPHIHLDITGKTDRVVTQMLFPNEALNETDDVVPKWARARLTASVLGKGSNGALRYGWDIVLDQG